MFLPNTYIVLFLSSSSPSEQERATKLLCVCVCICYFHYANIHKQIQRDIVYGTKFVVLVVRPSQTIYTLLQPDDEEKIPLINWIRLKCQTKCNNSEFHRTNNSKRNRTQYRLQTLRCNILSLHFAIAIIVKSLCDMCWVGTLCILRFVDGKKKIN